MGRLTGGDIVLLEMESAGLEPKRFLLRTKKITDLDGLDNMILAK